MEVTFEAIQKANESIKTTDIEGKEYAEVNQRIKAFRMVYPLGFIRTQLVSNNAGVAVFRAEVGIGKSSSAQAQLMKKRDQVSSIQLPILKTAKLPQLDERWVWLDL